MAERLSTGLVNALLDVGDLKTIMANGIIRFYAGTQPATADLAETGDLLLEITLSGGAFTPGVATNGLNLGDAAGGVISKATAETWKGTGKTAAGTGTAAGWFRWFDNDVVTGASSTAIRMDGLCGSTSTYECTGSNLVVVSGVDVTLNSFSFTLPKS